MEVKGFQFKYYKYQDGEEKNPYVGKDANAALWWDGEKTFHQRISEPDGDDFIKRLEEWFDDSFKIGAVSGPLADTSVPKSKRVLMFYLDLWHGKWYPDDDLDMIFDY